MEHLNVIIPSEPKLEEVKEKTYELQLSDRLRSLRKAHGKTLKEMSQIVGVSISTYAGYEAAKESNNHRVPALEKIMKLSDYFGVSVDYLIGNSEVRHQYTQTSVWDIIKNANIKPYEREMLVSVLSDISKKQLTLAN